MKLKKKNIMLITILSLGAIFAINTNFKNNVFAQETIDSKKIWEEVTSINDVNKHDTTDGIFVDFEETPNSKYLDFRIGIVADLADKNGATSILKNLNKDLTVKIKDNNKEILTKTATNYYASENKKNCFEFFVKHDELNLPKPSDDSYNGESKRYTFEIYDNDKLIGSFKKSLHLAASLENDESMKIITADKTKTTDRISYFWNNKGNLLIMLHPRLHSGVSEKNDKTTELPSVFAVKTPIKVDITDKEGNVILSKNTEQKYSYEDDDRFNSKMVEFDKNEVKKLNLDIPYTLKFYDKDSNLLGEKSIKSFNTPYYKN